jgi:hypothetical protein
VYSEAKSKDSAGMAYFLQDILRKKPIKFQCVIKLTEVFRSHRRLGGAKSGTYLVV